MIRPFVGRVIRTNKITYSYVEESIGYTYIIPILNTHFNIITEPVFEKGGSLIGYNYFINTGGGKVSQIPVPGLATFPITETLNLEFYTIDVVDNLLWLNWNNIFYLETGIENLGTGRYSPLAGANGRMNSITLSYPHGNAWARYLETTYTYITVNSVSFSNYLDFINNPPSNVSNIQIIGYY